MPIDMADLYAEDPGAAQVEEGTGQADYVPAPEATDAVAGSATAQGIDAAQVGPAAQATPQTGTASEATAALAAPGVSAAVDDATQNQAVAGSQGYTAETAANQLLEQTGQDSPLMQRAQQEGMLTAARRGLQNSSIAAGSSMGAMVDRATPIALQDSQSINQARAFEANAANEAAQLNAQMQQQTGLAGLDANTRAALQDAGLLTETGQFNANQINSMEQLNTQLGTQTEQFNASQRNSIATLNAQLAQDASQFTASEANRIEALNAQMETEVNVRNAAAATDASFLDAQLRAQINDANAARQLSLAQGNMQEANRQQQFIMDLNADLNKQFLAGTQAMDLAHIQGRYNQLISANENAARLFEAHFNSISSTMANEKLSPERVAAYVNVSQQMLTSGLAMIDEMNNIDLGNFTLPTADSTPGRGGTITSDGGSEPGYNDTNVAGDDPAWTPPEGVPSPGTPEWDDYIASFNLDGIFTGGGDGLYGWSGPQYVEGGG
jgi:hypothetical protein